MHLKVRFLIVFIILLSVLHLKANSTYNKKTILFDFNWKFSLSDKKEYSQTDFNDTNCEI